MKKTYITPASKVVISPEVCQQFTLQGSKVDQTTIDVTEQNGKDVTTRDHWIGGDTRFDDTNWNYAKPETWFEED